MLPVVNMCLTVFLYFPFIAVSACTNNPCLNNGTCEDFCTYYTCQCPPDYRGVNCETSKYITPRKVQLDFLAVRTRLRSGSNAISSGAYQFALICNRMCLHVFLLTWSKVWACRRTFSWYQRVLEVILTARADIGAPFEYVRVISTWSASIKKEASLLENSFHWCSTHLLGWDTIRHGIWPNCFHCPCEL